MGTAIEALIILCVLSFSVWIGLVFVGYLADDPFPHGPQSFNFPWVHDKFCVCNKCELKLIKEQRAILDKRYARQMREKLEHHVITELKEEYRREYGD